MIITVTSEKKYTQEDILNIDGLYGAQGPTNEAFRNGIILLNSQTGEELPLYLRSEVAGQLKSLVDKAVKSNTAIIIPDVVQKHLFQSKRLYPQRLAHFHSHIRPKDKEDTTAPCVEAAERKLGFLEKEKLLLLELLLGEQKCHLEEIVHTLRAHKVFCLKLKGEISPDRQYLIVKFDSTAAIDKEYENFEEIKQLFIGAQEFERYLLWKERIYNLNKPKGQDRDLFKIISSTVKTVGAVQDWASQTLKDRLRDKSSSELIGNIIDDVYSILGELYCLGYGKQETANPRERSIGEIYRAFYKQHIMPIDCVLTCELSNIMPSSTTGATTEDKDAPYPPAIGSEFEGYNYVIEEIKLRADKRGKPIISLIAKKGLQLVELKLGKLGGLPNRRELYSKEIKDGAKINFKGKVENNFENSLRQSVKEDLELVDGEFGTERVIPETEDLRQRQIKFIDGISRANPLYFYSQIHGDSAYPAASLKFTSLSTYIHGDLNVGNIIAPESGDVRIIDFARLVKDGPLEFDFAELEIDIRIRNLVEVCSKMHDPTSAEDVLQSNSKPKSKDVPESKRKPKSLETIVKELFKFEETLLKVFECSENEEELACRISENFKTGFLAIAKIRKKLIQMYGSLSGNPAPDSNILKAYMTAIYFESLAALNFGAALNPGSEELAKTWALVAATVACEKLFGSIEQTTHTGA